MKEIVFLSVQQVCGIQKATLPGVPSGNIGLLEGAINRVINQHHYNGISDIFELASMYLVAIAKAHAFPDANKRTAFQSALIFLQLNDVFVEESEEMVDVTVKAAEGSVTTEEIMAIFKKFRTPPD